MTCRLCKQALHPGQPCRPPAKVEAISEPRDKHDTLKTCRSCQGLRGAVCTRWRAAGMLGEHSPVFMGAFADMPQRCPGFKKGGT